MFETFFSTYLSSTIRFLFLLAPFFVVTMFLALTRGLSMAEKTSIIRRACVSAFILGVILFFAGPLLFNAIGITLNSFRIGAGSLLFLTAISLVNSGTRNHATGLPEEDRDDIAVVPLAIPVMIGPATIGAIMVYGAELKAVPDVAGGLLGLVSGLLILAGARSTRADRDIRHYWIVREAGRNSRAAHITETFLRVRGGVLQTGLDCPLQL